MTRAPLLLPDFELIGREVTLRPLQLTHAEALAAASGESRDAYSFSPVPSGLAQARKYIEYALAQQAAGLRQPLVTEWRGHVVGTTSYSDFQPWEWPAGSAQQRTDVPDSVEIGYTWLAASAQRTSCNTEAKLLMLQHAFEHWRVHSVCLRTDERNERSRNAILRLGCKLDGIRRGHMPASDGTLRNSAFFSMLATEWPDAKARLLTRLARS